MLSTGAPKSTTPSSAVLDLLDEMKITLQVGERTFHTTRDTLVEKSDFFAALLSGRWDNRQRDGSYFIDADAHLFEHILQYLRRGVFPIFFDDARGHDHVRYLALLEEAKYFQIARLEAWLRNKTYLRAVRVQYTASQPVSLANNTVTSERQLEHHVQWKNKDVYVCPRGIEVHRGNASACGRQCKSVQASLNRGPEYEKEQCVKHMVIEKTILFDDALCVDTPDLEL
ncbi:hypothetical protein PVAG01_05881 [Phlyctema vagabunda]|uniref:BTB domain-containing protein n=1 Tax=Phlyctema vagabunda TaxID=108571 RepID=A0ABR4PEI7_9HELO